DAGWVAETCARYPGRFFGMVSPDPRDVMASLRTIESCVRDHGFKAVKIEPFVWGKPPTHPMYYPIYAKCVELDITFTTQIGHTGPDTFPSEVGRPLYLDQLALDFPELRIVGGHIGWPWTEEAIAVAWKHRNVWIDTSAHIPKHFPPSFVHFMRTFGQDKCLFASDWPLLPIARSFPACAAADSGVWPTPYQPSPSAVARRSAASVSPPNTIGGWGFCTGFGSNLTGPKEKKRPWNSGSVSVQSVRSARTHSRVRAARGWKSMPA